MVLLSLRFCELFCPGCLSAPRAFDIFAMRAEGSLVVLLFFFLFSSFFQLPHDHEHYQWHRCLSLQSPRISNIDHIFSLNKGWNCQNINSSSVKVHNFLINQGWKWSEKSVPVLLWETAPIISNPMHPRCWQMWTLSTRHRGDRWPLQSLRYRIC